MEDVAVRSSHYKRRTGNAWHRVPEHGAAPLASLGAEAKAPLDAGLVDFPGEMDGRLIYLCWRLGEPSIQHWHEIDAGFAGRQPLSQAPASAESQ